MTSKIFSGDLPELLNEIIQYFQNDFSTLHSCILVNRLWCRLAIPLLWKDPFSTPNRRYHFIEIYLHDLNDNDKAKLNEYGISDDLFPSNILFNYPSFIKCLDTHKIFVSIRNWVSEYYSSTRLSDPTRITYKSLFKTFVENKANLDTLKFGSNEVDGAYDDSIIELILQNPNFVHNIKNLSLNNSSTNGMFITKFLSFISSNCNSISTLYFEWGNYSSQIINSQQNLKKISLGYDFPLYHPLSSLKNSNCSNTLKTIIFYKVNFKNIIILNEVFEQLNVLESIHILYCYSLNSDFVQQIINITKPFRLKSLFISKDFQIEPFQLLLQKSGDYLKNIGFESSLNESFKQQLFELTKEYCTKIQFFELLGFDNQNIYLAFDFIEIIKQNLNYLSINFCAFLNFDHDVELSSIVLQKLGQILPSKLEYLNLALKVNISDFEIFLKNSQNTFIKRLIIRNKMYEGSDDIFPHVKEYIMKKNRVKYLAIEEVFLMNRGYSSRRDLFSLKNEVKEFELYNIKVQNYSDLYIDCYNFVKEMY